ncbi:MAG: RNA polymerase sigma factor, partial [bacterium]
MLIRDLINGILNGDEFCLRTIVQRYYNMILRYMLRSRILKEDAEELYEDVFIHLWQNIHKLEIDLSRTEEEIEAHFKNFLYQIAWFKRGEYFRDQQTFRGKARRQTVSIEGEQFGDEGGKSILDKFIGGDKSPEQEILEFEKQKLIFYYLQMLFTKDRNVIELHFFEGRTYEEIIEITGEKTSAATLRKRAERALKKLKELIITDSIDYYLIRKRSGNTLSMRHLVESHPLSEYCGSALEMELKEEQNLFDWFASKTDPELQQLFDCNKQADRYVLQHFAQKKTYREIANNKNDM